MDRDLKKLGCQCRAWARLGGSLSRRLAEEPLDVRVKSGKADFATNADRAVEASITASIRCEYPEDSIVTEEELSSTGTSGWTWVLDPIDGTTNFIKDIPLYCTSLAVLYNGLPVAAAIEDTVRGRSIWAVKGEGAYLDRQRIWVAKRGPLAVCTVSTEFSGRTQAIGNPVLRADSPQRFGHVRGLGSTCLGLAYTACGFLDLAFYRGANPWDAAAGVLLIEEAGGVVTTWTGEPYVIGESLSLTGGCPDLVKEFVDLVKSQGYREGAAASER